MKKVKEIESFIGSSTNALPDIDVWQAIKAEFLNDLIKGVRICTEKSN